jgi:acyl-CoA synthetase (AMP-forming)/AMP-acid ligase II/acyl carrier protein
MSSRDLAPPVGLWTTDAYANLHDFGTLIETSSQAYGDDIYLRPVESDLRALSFRDVERFVRGFEALLERQGVLRGESCALLSNNGTTMVLEFLAIIATNRVCVPLNPNSSADEIAYIISDSGAKAVFYEAALEEKASFLTETCELMAVDTSQEFIDKVISLADQRPERKAKPSGRSVAEVVYTTGSTGRPKGVQLTHQNLLADMHGIGRAFGFGRGTTFMTVTPLFHNSGQIMTTLIPLYCGGITTAIRPDMGFINFWHYVDKYQPEWTLVMPSHIVLTLDRREAPKSQSLRGILCGGAKLEPQTQRGFEQRFGVEIFANYGLTESTSIATCVRPGETQQSPGSVGRPLDINEVKVFKDNREASPNVVGEIWIRGDNVFGGYLNLPDVFKEKVQFGWLRTGDLGYADDLGNFFIVDRIDNMVLVGGENVYPSEVERFVPELPGVSEAFLLAVPDRVMGNELVLIYRLSPGAEPDVKGWKTFLYSKLVSFKVPRRFIDVRELGLADFPRSQSGKLLRKRLQNALETSLGVAGVSAASGTNGSRSFSRVAEILADVLEMEVDEITPRTSMDHVPSWDSLAHMRLMLSLESAFSTSFSPEQIIAMVRVDKIVDILDRLQQNKA